MLLRCAPLNISGRIQILTVLYRLMKQHSSANAQMVMRVRDVNTMWMLVIQIRVKTELLAQIFLEMTSHVRADPDSQVKYMYIVF